MKATCLQENFKKAVFSTEKVTGKQTTLPILGNIMIETERGRLKFSATNLEIGVICRIGAKIEEEGKVTVPARLLSNFINNLPVQEKIEIKVSEQTLSLSVGKYKTQIKGLDSEDFPLIPKMTEKPLFSLDINRLKSALSEVLVCVANNETRMEFTGVNLQFSEEDLGLAATDSFRLAEAVIPIIKDSVDENFHFFLSRTSSVIIPSGTAHEIIRIASGSDENVNVAIGENQIFFETGDTQIVSRLISGKYPDYKQIIPGQFGTRAVIAKEEITRAVKVSSIFTDNRSGEVEMRIDVKGKKIIIHSKSHDSGENIVELEADIVGPDQEVVLNPRYILDGLGIISSSKVAILANNDFSPVGFKKIKEGKGEVEDNFIYIIMPVKK